MKPDISGSNWSVIECGRGLFWMDRGISKAPKADIYLFNTPIIPVWRSVKKSVVIALDFAYLDFHSPGILHALKRYILKQYHRFSLKRSDQIIAISHATEGDVIQRFHIPQQKIRVIYPGFSSVCEISPKYVSVPKPFFLFIGVIKERKNVHGVIEAFIKLLKEDATVSLVVAGNGEGDYYEQIISRVKTANALNRIYFLGHISAAEVSYLFQNARALVFPSLTEGFGFPVLEGMECGIPVITSNSSSLVELGGDAAYLVDPRDPESIYKGMKALLYDENIHQKLILRGYEQVKKFSWNRSAREFLLVLEELCGQK